MTARRRLLHMKFKLPNVALVKAPSGGFRISSFKFTEVNCGIPEILIEHFLSQPVRSRRSGSSMAWNDRPEERSKGGSRLSLAGGEDAWFRAFGGTDAL
jgi:hypothetical protein